jgi:TOMM system kinase/cyclase fusion protein
MVGRDSELKTMKSYWKETENGRGVSLLVSGEPGIGKSRITYETRQHVTDSGHMSVVFRCLPEHMNSGLFPVLELLKSRLHLNETQNPEDGIRKIEKALSASVYPIEWSLPILCSWLSIPIPESYPAVPHSPQQRKKIVIDVFTDFLLNLAGGMPQMIIAEDLHWSDQVTLDLIGHMISRINGARTMILMTARPEFIAPWDKNEYMEIRLSRIHPGDAGSMIESLAGGKTIHQNILDLVYKRTDGIPLFIEELVRLMIDKGHLTKENGGLCLAERLDHESVPITLQDLLNEKLGRLGSAMETAQTASVIGREFDYTLIVGVSLRDEESLQADLDLMASSGIVYRQRRVKGECFIFRHALIRDAAYSSMVHTVRNRIHGRVAEVLENVFPDRVKADPGVMARHFAETGDYEKAVSYGIQAANDALERSLNDETIFHGEKTLVWTDKLSNDKRQETKLLITNILTLAMMSKYGWADLRVRTLAEMSRTLLGEIGDCGYTVPTLWSLAMYHHVAGNRSEVRELTDELETFAQRTGDQGLEVASSTFLGLRYQTDGHYMDAAQALEKAVRLYDPALHGEIGKRFAFDPRVWAAATLAIVHWFTGYDAIASECGENAVTWARELNHIPSLGIALLYRGLGHYHAGNREGVLIMTSELLELSKKYGLPAFEGYGTVLQCWAMGDGKMAESILETLRQMGCRLGLTLYSSMLADICARKGDIDAALKQIDTCIGLCREIDEHVHEPVIHLRRAQYLLKKIPEGDSDIRESLGMASDLARAQGMHRIEAESLHELLRVFGNDDGLQKQYEELLALRPEIAITFNFGWM